MDSRIMDVRGSVVKTFHAEEGRTVEVTEQNLDGIIEAVKRKRETHVQDNEMKLAAVIPGVIVEKMMRDGSWGDPQALKRWMNDPQNECFRVWKGKV